MKINDLEKIGGYPEFSVCTLEFQPENNNPDTVFPKIS